MQEWGVSSLTCNCFCLQEPSSAPKQPVEFDQAINYVNKIKVKQLPGVLGVGKIRPISRLTRKIWQQQLPPVDQNQVIQHSY